MNTNARLPEASPGQSALATEITDKSGFARRWLFSTRTVENLMTSGLPHFKIGKRRVRISIAEGDAWMHERYSTQRRAA